MKFTVMAATLLALSGCGVLPRMDHTTEYPRLSEMKGTHVSTVYSIYGVPEAETMADDGAITHEWAYTESHVNTNYDEDEAEKYTKHKSLGQKILIKTVLPTEEKVNHYRCALNVVSKGGFVQSADMITDGQPASHLLCTDFLNKWYKYQEGKAS